MLSLRPHLPLCSIVARLHLRHALHTSSTASDSVHTPKPPVELDPALQALLRDTDLSLLRAKGRHADVPHGRTHRELEIIDTDVDAPLIEDRVAAEEAEEARLFPRNERKSPAASFGSRAIGAVVLPFELQRSILRLISESDKPMVHADASRLFREENAAEDAWSTRYAPPDYTLPKAGSRMSHIKARLARNRDGTAFASVVMPAQYAVVTAVLANVVSRLGPEWARGVQRVVEWGSGTGAGMWAALNAFGGGAQEDATLAASRIASYIGVEKREGLVTIARRLLRDIPLGDTAVSLQKSLHSSDRLPQIEGLGTVALSTFALSTLGSPGQRRQMIREMWDSGADVIVVIDEASVEGFLHIADARERLLKFGRREADAIEEDGAAPDADRDDHGKRGAHVVAPCPHDFACPIALATGAGVRCTFEQRLQRPTFVRRTKHTGQGEEDVGYAYVVVRRGARPQPQEGTARAISEAEGKLGAVGRWAEEAARAKETARDEREVQQARWASVAGDDIVVEASDEMQEADEAAWNGVEDTQADEGSIPADATAVEEASTMVEDVVAEKEHVDQALEDALRLEAYNWPRINFPPLKRSGHILIDACMPNGHEMRLTFPRSQGKQIFYDARKSSWGDIFPHASKHRPIPRYKGSRQEGELAPREKGQGRGRGGEGELAKVGVRAATRARWGSVMDTLKEEDRRKRRERRRERSAKEMSSELEE